MQNTQKMIIILRKFGGIERNSEKLKIQDKNQEKNYEK